MTVPPAARDAALLVARVVLGVIFTAHGLQKLQWGQGAVAKAFEGMGAPLPSVSGVLVTWIELLGGIALIAGVATPLVAGLLLLDMLGAILLVHLGHGVFVDQGGWELVGALAVGCLVAGVLGAGRWSVDELVLRRRGLVLTSA